MPLAREPLAECQRFRRGAVNARRCEVMCIGVVLALLAMGSVNDAETVYSGLYRVLHSSIGPVHFPGTFCRERWWSRRHMHTRYR